MRVPFTQRQFLDVFGADNATAWPAVVILWLVTFAFGRAPRARAAALTLGVTPDLMLLVAAVCLVVYVALPFIVHGRTPLRS